MKNAAEGRQIGAVKRHSTYLGVIGSITLIFDHTSTTALKAWNTLLRDRLWNAFNDREKCRWSERFSSLLKTTARFFDRGSSAGNDHRGCPDQASHSQSRDPNSDEHSQFILPAAIWIRPDRCRAVSSNPWLVIKCAFEQKNFVDAINDRLPLVGPVARQKNPYDVRGRTLNSEILFKPNHPYRMSCSADSDSEATFSLRSTHASSRAERF